MTTLFPTHHTPLGTVCSPAIVAAMTDARAGMTLTSGNARTAGARRHASQTQALVARCLR